MNVRTLKVLLASVGLIISTSAFPQGVSLSTAPFNGPGPGEAYTAVCMDCFFPITVAGATAGSANGVPAMAAKESICWCNIFPGVVWGEWLPLRLIEVVRTPLTSPTMGMSLPGSQSVSAKSSLQGGLGSGKLGTTHQGFYNMHVFAYPFGSLASGILSMACLRDESGGEGDKLWMSEIDPSWDTDSLAVIMSPEAALFANMPAQLACMVDAAASDVYQPIDPMFWCLGSWGGAYPEDGGSQTADAPRQAAYITAKATAMMMRRGMIQKTMGDDAVCGAYYEPELVKSQFKLQQVWPKPELTGNHWFGQDPNIWGEFRYMPIKGENFINLEWQFINCCAM